MILGAIFSTIILIGLYVLGYYIFLPPLSISFFSGFLFFGIGVVLLIFLIFKWYNVIKENDGINEKQFMIILSVVGVVFLVPVFVLFGGSSIFHAEALYRQIGDIEEKSFKDDLVEIDNSQIPTVDISLADILGDKKLGEELALGSQAHVGDFTNKQAVNGKLLYIAPLDHNGFFQWMNNSDGTPGFIKISATNSNDVQLTKDVNLKYLQSAYFGDDLKRHLRFSGFTTQGLTEFSFELNDEGKPYWVVTTYENTILWGTPEATGVIICDPQTGECDWYSIEDTPNWVDIIQPENFVINQIKNHGRYVHGWLNLSKKDELSMTDHITTVYNDGECYYYTGLSSVGEDNGTVGFILVNTRDKSSKMYRMVGATESAAMSSAEGKVQNMHYTSTTPIPLNVSGVPTYFSTLKDGEGLVKQYAMINIEDYSIVATGNSIMEAKRAYINAVNSSGRTVDFSSSIGENQKIGTVTRIGSNIENGNTYYYIILDNDMTKLYLASYSISEELPVTRETDQVSVTYTDTAGTSINLVSFDNIGITN